MADKQKKTQRKIQNVIVNGQYLKDLSFENPAAPASLINKGETPKINVSFDVQAKNIQENIFEVTLLIGAQAVSTEQKNVFLVEMHYSGLFTLNVAENEIEPVLMVYCPSLLFPFARQILSDVVRNGGFPPLMIDPVDFAALYSRYKKQQAEAQKEADGKKKN